MGIITWGRGITRIEYQAISCESTKFVDFLNRTDIVQISLNGGQNTSLIVENVLQKYFLSQS